MRMKNDKLKSQSIVMGNPDIMMILMLSDNSAGIENAAVSKGYVWDNEKLEEVYFSDSSILGCSGILINAGFMGASPDNKQIMNVTPSGMFLLNASKKGERAWTYLNS